MKQMIVLSSMICLGVLVFNLVAGPEGSLYQCLKQVWHQEAVADRYYP